MLSNRRSAEGETAACKEDVQWKILHYKLADLDWLLIRGCSSAADADLWPASMN